MTGVLLHVLCDAANNLGVIAAALVIWLAKYDGRYYADPGTSMGIGLMIILSSIPLGTLLPRVDMQFTLTSGSTEVRINPSRERSKRGRSGRCTARPREGKRSRPLLFQD